jgi:hypothetical protein
LLWKSWKSIIEQSSPWRSQAGILRSRKPQTGRSVREVTGTELSAGRLLLHACTVSAFHRVFVVLAVFALGVIVLSAIDWLAWIWRRITRNCGRCELDQTI